jgi:AraC family transcriptional regulator
LNETVDTVSIKIMPTPSKNINRIEYEKRVNRVMNYIIAHMDEDLSLEKLADVAAFSSFHFHRVFKSITGETLNEFIQRTRIERAASQLKNSPHQSVLEVALDHGFNSAAAFARVFKEHFNMSATEWRNGGADEWSKIRKEVSNNSKQVSNLWKENLSSMGNDSSMQINMNATLKDLPAYHVAYIRHTGPYGEETAQLWNKLVNWAMERGLWTQNVVSLGVSYDDPRVTASDKCRYDACVVVPNDFKADTIVNITDMPAGKYATFEFIGIPQEVGAAWDRLFSEWLPSSGFQPDNRPNYGLFDGTESNAGDDQVNDPKTKRFKCHLCIPVKPL